jgi:hypothetical protein
LSPADEKQKRMYEAQLKRAVATKNAFDGHMIHASTGSEKMPWNRASAMLPQLTASGNTTSSVSRMVSQLTGSSSLMDFQGLGYLYCHPR